MFIWFILYVFIENFDFESEFLGSKSDLEMGAILGGPAGRASTEKLRLTSSIETAFFLKIFSVGINKTKSLRLRSGVERGAGLWKWCNLYRI